MGIGMLDEININEKTLEKMKIMEKQVNDNYLKSFELLNKYFKTLYENAGM